jgi:sodium-dependent phosphate cotransporter
MAIAQEQSREDVAGYSDQVPAAEAAVGLGSRAALRAARYLVQLSSGGYVLTVRRIATVLFLLFAFLVGINGMSAGFKMLGKDVLGAFFAATENPFVGLVVGILSTSLVQSSSVTTSMIVAMVAAPENPLPIANAVPMVMGANIGTTVTNAIVSLGHMGRKEEFRRAFAVATCHDFFNLTAVVLLLPLEMATGFLQRTAGYYSSLLGGVGGVTYESPLHAAIKSGAEPLEWLAQGVFSSQGAQAALLIALSAGTIFLALAFLVRVLKSIMKTRVEVYLSRALGGNALIGLLVGVVVTASVQSSSITTSLLVPLGAAGILKTYQAFPITLGANVGTTVTALLASLAVAGVNAHAGVQIALVHTLFNVVGMTVLYPYGPLRKFPIRAAKWLARVAVESRTWAIVYILVQFYVLPALLIYVSKLLS